MDSRTKTQAKESLTAVTVMQAFARAMQTTYGYLFDKREILLASHMGNVGAESLRKLNWCIAKGLSAMPFGFQSRFFNFVVVPNYDEVIMLRKIMIREKIEEAIRNGIKQFVFLGGGYDIRAFMTAANHPEVTVFEIDRSPTRAFKLQGLTSIPKEFGFPDADISAKSHAVLTINKNLHFVESDLSRDDLSHVLLMAGFDDAVPALFIAEGLTMYLDEAANQALLSAFNALIHPDNQLLISYLNTSKYGVITKNRQSSTDELAQFHLLPNQVIPVMTSAGLNVSGRFTSSDWLIEIGIADATHYQNEKNMREDYYLIGKQCGTKYASMQDVPKITFSLPEAPAVKSDKKCETCRIL